MSTDADESTRTIGPLLQEARTAKGLTIEAAAAASKVPLSYVRLMEQEQFHLVPDPLYLTRFLTDYATFLGLDPKQVVAQLKEQVTSARTSELSNPVSAIGSQMDRRRLLMYLLPAAAVIPLIFIGLSLFSGSPPTMPPAQTTPSLPSAETSAPPPDGLGATTPGPQATSLNPESPKELTPAGQVTAPQAQEPQSPLARYRLRAEAKETTWLAVSSDGAPRKGVLLRQGETSQWSANNGFVVTIGNSQGVILTLNDRPISLKREAGLVIKNLALPGNGEPSPVGQ